MRKLHVKFWEYDGNHPDGRDCERQDPHNFGLALISYVAYCADNGQFQNNELNLADIKVTHSKGDSFGHIVEVSTTKEVWEAARLDYTKYLDLVEIR